MFRLITVWFAMRYPTPVAAALTPQPNNPSHPLRVQVHTFITITAISLAAFTVLYIFRHLLILFMMLKNPLYAPRTAVKA